jgi:hypothetical protein
MSLSGTHMLLLFVRNGYTPEMLAFLTHLVEFYYSPSVEFELDTVIIAETE